MTNDLVAFSKCVECSICFNIPTEFRFLACGHSYCDVCCKRLLNMQLHRIKCPVCAKFTIGLKDVSKLPKNYQLQSLIETYNRAKKEMEEKESELQEENLDSRKLHTSNSDDNDTLKFIVCSVCRLEKTDALFGCVHCRNPFCADCYKNHMASLSERMTKVTNEIFEVAQFTADMNGTVSKTVNEEKLNDMEILLEKFIEELSQMKKNLSASKVRLIDICNEFNRGQLGYRIGAAYVEENRKELMKLMSFNDPHSIPLASEVDVKICEMQKNPEKFVQIMKFIEGNSTNHRYYVQFFRERKKDLERFDDNLEMEATNIQDSWPSNNSMYQSMQTFFDKIHNDIRGLPKNIIINSTTPIETVRLNSIFTTTSSQLSNSSTNLRDINRNFTRNCLRRNTNSGNLSTTTMALSNEMISSNTTTTSNLFGFSVPRTSSIQNGSETSPLFVFSGASPTTSTTTTTTTSNLFSKIFPPSKMEKFNFSIPTNMKRSPYIFRPSSPSATNDLNPSNKLANFHFQRTSTSDLANNSADMEMRGDDDIDMNISGEIFRKYSKNINRPNFSSSSSLKMLNERKKFKFSTLPNSAIVTLSIRKSSNISLTNSLFSSSNSSSQSLLSSHSLPTSSSIHSNLFYTKRPFQFTTNTETTKQIISSENIGRSNEEEMSRIN
ncbi:hypothetical protein SNEBB_010770 [Seison nebaliae]|nr:hypothetical protein SNEBB_010770 [Seison nebaliae]